jgi:hypothetical protein
MAGFHGPSEMKIPSYERYLEYRRRFAVSREMAVSTLEWAEPLARQALGIHAQRDMMDMGDKLQFIPVMTTNTENGGWGELMPIWFKPYERPVPIFILDNWAMLALMWQYWLGDVGSAFSIKNLLRIFVGGDLLIPFLPEVQRGGHFLRHGVFTIFLGTLWLEPEVRDAFVAYNTAAANRFANAYQLDQQADLSGAMSQLEFEAFFVAEGNRVGGEKGIQDFLANTSQFETYAALFGGLSLSLAAYYDWYGPNWEQWVFQKVNVDYRLARFGLEAWAKWLGVPYVNPPTNSKTSDLFISD